MRGIISALTGAAALMGVAGTLAGQTPAPRKEPSMDLAMMKRAILGVQLSGTGTKRDTIGVFVSRVTPKGPAENAGIVEGDRLVSINGVDLRVNAADAGDDYASGLPSRRLTREVEKLSPGNVVTLRVSSGGRVRDIQVTAGKASDFRENGFGYTIGGGPDGFSLRSFPRMNMEGFNMPMMHMEEFDMSPMRMRLDEGGNWKMREPSRVRVTAPEGRVYIYRDSAGTLRRSKALSEKTEKAAEKAKKESEKKE